MGIIGKRFVSDFSFEVSMVKKKLSAVSHQLSAIGFHCQSANTAAPAVSANGYLGVSMLTADS
jgi:hypothetical protein